jgi:hypothetical protein
MHNSDISKYTMTEVEDVPKFQNTTWNIALETSPVYFKN